VPRPTPPPRDVAGTAEPEAGVLPRGPRRAKLPSQWAHRQAVEKGPLGGPSRPKSGRPSSTARSGCMNDDVEALVESRRDEIAREQIVCLFADLVRVLAVRIALPKPLLTDRVRKIQ
jgi:hypothetical protein